MHLLLCHRQTANHCPQVFPDLYRQSFVATLTSYAAFQMLLQNRYLLLQLQEKSYCERLPNGAVKAYLAFRLKKHSNDLELRLFGQGNGVFITTGHFSRTIWKLGREDDELKVKIQNTAQGLEDPNDTRIRSESHSSVNSAETSLNFFS